MKEVNIQSILEKYWEAETSIEEENILRSYFLYGQVAPEHEAFRPMFDFFAEEKSQQYDKALSFDPKTQIKPLVPWRKRVLSIAAIFVVLMAATWVFRFQQTGSLNDTMEYASVENPDEALNVTMEALALLGKKLNHSSNHIHQNILHTEKMDIIKPNQ